MELTRRDFLKASAAGADARH
ncbi:MAG: twin-arginine translocation signal domain-containing protein [Actinomycetota bacterium]